MNDEKWEYEIEVEETRKVNLKITHNVIGGTSEDAMVEAHIEFDKEWNRVEENPCVTVGEVVLNEFVKPFGFVVPYGWVLVPIVPTALQVAEAETVEDLYRRGTPDTWVSVYRAMINTAPIYTPD